MGVEVAVAGGSATPRRLEGVDWLPATRPHADIAVALNDARLLPARAHRHAIWFHNEVRPWRELRRGRLPALLRHRPEAVFLGTGQRAGGRLLPFRRRHTLPHGLTPPYLAAPLRKPPAPLALFTSQAYRGLAEILALWRRDVAPTLPGARLEARIAAADLAAFRSQSGPGIAIEPRLPNAVMPLALRQARLLLAPGHVSETFCLAAAEAIASGVPVVTRGWGALAERVHDGETGFVCASWTEFAARSRQVLTDDTLWRRLHEACLAQPRLSWPDAARLWLAAFGQVDSHSG